MQAAAALAAAGGGASCPSGAGDAGAAGVVPALLLFSLVCCLCGYGAFLWLEAQARRGELQSSAAAERPPPAIEPPPALDAGGVGAGGEAAAVATAELPPIEARGAAAEAKALAATVQRESPLAAVAAPRPASTLASEGSGSLAGARPAPRSPLAPAARAERAALAADVPDGEQSWEWPDGSQYFGEWQGRRAHGRGVFSWPSGDRYEGEWEAGKESGVGTLIAADGSTFHGFWADGWQHGEGVFKPAAVEGGGAAAEVMFLRQYERGRLARETVLRVKEYDLHRKELKRDGRARRTEKRQAALEMAGAIPRPGEKIYKGHRSYDLMRNLQMGILFSIAKTNREASQRGPAAGPSAPDYREQVSQQFPRSGQSTSFKWKDYCPSVFHQLRQAFGIDDSDYLLSLTGDKALRELPSPGKSGSVFFLSDDDRFMIKTVRKEEMRLLLELIPTYHAHCASNPDTLLTRFYGVHRVKPINGHHVRFLVMGNVFPTDTRLHRRFDLKGSTYGRTAGARRNDPSATLKDLDVDFRLQLGEAYHSKLMRQIEADAALLERMHVMDYSLLLGMHYADWDDDWHPPQPDGKGDEAEGDWQEGGAADEWGLRRDPLGGGAEGEAGGNADKPSATGSFMPSPSSSLTSMSASTAHASTATAPTPGWFSPLRPAHLQELRRASGELASTAGRPGSRCGAGEDSSSPTAPPRLLELMSRRQLGARGGPGGQPLLHTCTRSGWLRQHALGMSMRSLHSEARKRLGASIPAIAYPLAPDGRADTEAKAEPVVLYFGIIDFLQDYNMRKRTEHVLKSLVQDGRTISVTNPHTYSQRFVLHLQQLFAPVPRGEPAAAAR